MMISIVMDMVVIALTIMRNRTSMMTWIRVCSTIFNLVKSLNGRTKFHESWGRRVAGCVVQEREIFFIMDLKSSIVP